MRIPNIHAIRKGRKWYSKPRPSRRGRGDGSRRPTAALGGLGVGTYLTKALNEVTNIVGTPLVEPEHALCRFLRRAGALALATWRKQ